jgi:hypothetical protein
MRNMSINEDLAHDLKRLSAKVGILIEHLERPSLNARQVNLIREHFLDMGRECTFLYANSLHLTSEVKSK